MYFCCIILDSLIVAVKPKPPVKDGHENDDDDEDLVKLIKQHIMKCSKCQFGTWCHVFISAEVSASPVIKPVEKKAILFSTW